MKKIRVYLSIIAGFLISANVFSQIGPPSLRCLYVNVNGDITLTWVIPPDPSGSFASYTVYSSIAQNGPFISAGTITSYTQNTFTHVGANGNTQSRYYYLVSTSNTSVVSAPSDTLRSVFLNIGNILNGTLVFTWNKTATPLLPSASPTYTLSKEYPPTVWTQLYAGPNFTYWDTISICSVFYNYRIQTSDAASCISQSNINGTLFHDHWGPNIPFLDSVTVNPGGTATLGWEASTSTDASRYVIYRVDLVTNGNIAIDTINGRFNTTYTDLTAGANANSRTYYVGALDSCRNISQFPRLAHSTLLLNLDYDFCARTSKLSWTKYNNLPPDGVLQYNVYCSVNGAPATVIGSTSATSFSHPNLNPGDNYCYFIRVVNRPESITASSNIKCLLATAPHGPAYVYIRSVSVTPDKQVAITYAIDNSRAYKGATIFKSKDGITFNQIYYQAGSTATLQTYVDKDVSVTEKNYYYKVQISDSCGNLGNVSNISKTVLLHVSNDNENIFYNTLTWDDYSSWSGNVASYNIYRAVNGVFDTSPVTNVPYGTRVYVDDVEEFVSDQGKFSYYVEAVEGGGNIYGFQDVAHSNPADAYVEVSVFVPNSFCPNGLNKIWLPVAQFVEKTDYKVTVFDRWGSKVFQTSSDTEGWDGYGEKDEVYVYLIEYKNARGEFIQLKGYVTLIK